ncbi:MAG: CRISPR-associated protein Cas4 [Chloroflexi bacterium]|nr:CRISPR-associated protein Cas4 [Chloroflexota bacterium]
MPLLIVALLLLGLLLLLLARRQRSAAGLPAGRVVYSDTGGWGRLESPLFSPARLLTGKPDYLVQEQGRVIPVEVKSARAPQRPYDSHIYQLAAYCMLVEDAYGVRPGHGLIRYADRSFAVDYTPELEAAVSALLTAMRADASAETAERSHNSQARCRACGYRPACDQSLV